MKVIENSHRLEYFNSGLLDRYFKDMTFCVFDIETLGLNGDSCPVVLAGLMTVEKDGSCRLTQYFAETPDDEVSLLKALDEYLSSFDYIITYNGRHFDMPFIKKRASLLGLSDFSADPYNLDLYLIVNGHSPFRKMLKSLRQSSVEEYMGLSSDRLDEISGKESIDLYYKYLNCRDSSLKASLMDRILLHNHDDLMQLYRILPIIRQTDMHSAMNALGFPVKGENGWPNLNVRTLRLSARSLSIWGTYGGPGLTYTCFSSPELPFNCVFDSSGSFEASVPVQNIKGNIYVNALQLLDDASPVEMLGGHVNGFLILSRENKRNPLEINMISRELLLQFMRKTPFF